MAPSFTLWTHPGGFVHQALRIVSLWGLISLVSPAWAEPNETAEKPPVTKPTVTSTTAKPVAKPGAKSATKATGKATPKPATASGTRTASSRPSAAAADSASKVPSPSVGEQAVAALDSAASAVVRVVDFIAHPALQVATWPVENVLAPGVTYLTYPTQPPLRYFLEENVIDRAAGLFQFGSNQDFSVYPTLSLAAGTASRTGVTLRDGSPFGRENDRLTSYFSYYVNGDYRFRSFYSSKGLADTRFNGKVAFGLNRQEASTFYQPDVNLPYTFGLNSESYESEADYPVLEEFRARVGFTLTNIRFDRAPPALANQTGNVLTSDFFDTDTGYDATGASRGLTQSFFDRTWQAGLVRDTRTNENIPLDGSRLEALWYYHDADRHHDFHEWRARYTTYFKLGSERYELTAREERERGGLSVDQFLRKLEYQRLRQTIFSRKVLIFHLQGGQSYEVGGTACPSTACRRWATQRLCARIPVRAIVTTRWPPRARNTAFRCFASWTAPSSTNTGCSGPRCGSSISPTTCATHGASGCACGGPTCSCSASSWRSMACLAPSSTPRQILPFDLGGLRASRWCVGLDRNTPVLLPRSSCPRSLSRRRNQKGPLAFESA